MISYRYPFVVSGVANLKDLSSMALDWWSIPDIHSQTDGIPISIRMQRKVATYVIVYSCATSPVTFAFNREPPDISPAVCYC